MLYCLSSSPVFLHGQRGPFSLSPVDSPGLPLSSFITQILISRTLFILDLTQSPTFLSSNPSIAWELPVCGQEAPHLST